MLAAVLALAVPKPHVVWQPIPFGPERKAQTAAYMRRHYGLPSWRLRPRAIVLHYTASESLRSAIATFTSNAPDGELGELPGTCAHFVVDRDGTIYQLVRLDVVCRHTVGLNWAAIGIEHVGTSDGEILRNRRQLAASLRLTLWLADRYRIRLANVIGHAESLSSPFHRERYAAWRCQTHGDWPRPAMQVYRARLVSLAGRYRVALGPPPRDRVGACR